MDVQKKLQEIYAGKDKVKKGFIAEVAKKDPSLKQGEEDDARIVEESKNAPLDKYLEEL